MKDDKSEPKTETRRSLLKKTGSIGIGGGAVTAGITYGTGNAKGMIYISPGTIYKEEIETLCDLAPEGLAVWAAASLTDPIPGDSIFLGIAAAGSSAACAVRDEFVEHYPDADAIKVKRPEDQSEDIFVEPVYDPPWWIPPIV